MLQHIHITIEHKCGASFDINPEKFVKSFDKEKIKMMVEVNPRAIVNNNAIPDMGPMIDPQKKSSIFSFIKK